MNWRAIIFGFLTAVALSILSGATIPFTGVTLPFLTYAFIGLVAGGVAGYYTKDGMVEGAFHGGVATTLGGIVLLGVLAVLGVLFAGLVGTLGIVAAGFLVIAMQAIPGAIGGGVAGWFGRRQVVRETQRSVAR